MVTPSGAGTTGPVGGYPGQSYYEDEQPGYQQRSGETSSDTEEQLESGAQDRPGGGSGESSGTRSHRDETSLAEEAGYGPAPGSGSGGFGQEAGFMNGESDDPGADDAEADDGRDVAEGGYPVDRDGSQFGRPDAGDEARNPDY